MRAADLSGDASPEVLRSHNGDNPWGAGAGDRRYTSGRRRLVELVRFERRKT